MGACASVASAAPTAKASLANWISLPSTFDQNLLLSFVAEASFKPCKVTLMPGGRLVDSSLREAETAPILRPDALCALFREDIDKVLRTAGLSGQWSLFQHELLRYVKGSFFAVHYDGHRPGDHHVGTLLIVAPSTDAVGGKLVVNGSIVGKDDRTPYIAFIPLGAPHEVTVLCHGTRVVAKSSVSGFLKSSLPPMQDSLAARANIIPKSSLPPRKTASRPERIILDGME